MSGVLFVTGIGTDVGKTVASAILVKALQADYWKPVQSGASEGTDGQRIQQWLGSAVIIHPETYCLQRAVSPHLAAREEGVHIELHAIHQHFQQIHRSDRWLVIEGAGGLLVPLNETQTFLDLIALLQVPVVLVSRQYLGSLNHTLLTARVLQQSGIAVAGWISNGSYESNEADLKKWLPWPELASLPRADTIDGRWIEQQASRLELQLLSTFQPAVSA
ncbi:MAG: dethiobiotin synthase [Thermoflavifilum sp.]|uniref:dethiobiotin synthase n=1 Tax=Thermoflavifilum sp. TaxID=1968839 RepID=UPI0018A69261|nr:dethiobiotin synthase [Thermoflavifilum sp.]QOR76119.1 MAG: dethiobiotin synthase [Thermoflavifilum sp.]